MKKAINLIGAVALAAVAYGIGSAEGKNVKEKATAFGIGLYLKGKELVEKVFPSKEAPAEENNANAAEEEK